MKHLVAFLIAFMVCAPVFAATTTITAAGVSTTAASIATSGQGTVVSTANTMQVLNTQGDVFFVVNDNDAANACTITFTPAVSSINVRGYGPLATANVTVSATTKTVWVVGPFPALAWNSSGYVQWTATGTGCPTTYINALYVRPL